MPRSSPNRLALACSTLLINDAGKLVVASLSSRYCSTGARQHGGTVGFDFGRTLHSLGADFTGRRYRDTEKCHTRIPCFSRNAKPPRHDSRSSSLTKPRVLTFLTNIHRQSSIDIQHHHQKDIILSTIFRFTSRHSPKSSSSGITNFVTSSSST